jgi:hypothetical protein
LRPRLDGDPPPVPSVFNRHELNRLHFVRWRLATDCAVQIARSAPPNAA